MLRTEKTRRKILSVAGFATCLLIANQSAHGLSLPSSTAPFSFHSLYANASRVWDLQHGSIGSGALEPGALIVLGVVLIGARFLISFFPKKTQELPAQARQCFSR